MSNNLADLLRQARRPRVLVVGDLMLDRYVWGNVDRVSYEAPIPVLRVREREERLGGAGSVLAMLDALEVDAVPVGVVGDDHDGRVVRELVGRLKAPCDAIVAVAGRPTTVKERFLGRTQSRHPQQMMRVDHECVEPVDLGTESSLLAAACGRLDQVDLVLVSDYAKGVCTPALLAGLIRQARMAGVKVVVDPGREVDYRFYTLATCVTPNRAEAAIALGRTVLTPGDGLEAARGLVETFGFDAAAVTMDRDGIAWADTLGRSRMFPVRPRQVYDITGAGDAVLAAMGLGLTLGADWPAVIQLANLAGGLEVERLGVTPISRRQLLAEMNDDGRSGGSKVVSRETLDRELDLRRNLRQQIVMTNGCFDLLHPGHVSSLEYARSLGDCLVVGLNSDESVVRLKGKGRPIIDQRGRAQMLAALACVDYVVIFDEPSVAALVELVRPDILVKAAQYAPEQVVGGDFVRSLGGQVVLAPVVEGLSTSEILQRAGKFVSDKEHRAEA
ncbi:MAG: PfkB family carbohydrate kinase [Thermoguttaceae bacterium]